MGWRYMFESESKDMTKITWFKAAYQFHTYAYRDPRSVFASAVGLPVVSPTTVLLGIASTLFRLGKADEAKSFLKIVHKCKVRVDPPDGIIFFRAFHQLRRYETDKYGFNPRLGLTNINQGTREYGLVDGNMVIFIGVPTPYMDPVKLALTNLTHLGTHDSLCSLVGKVEYTSEPIDVVYMPSEKMAEKVHNEGIESLGNGVTVVTLSSFKPEKPIQPVSQHWWMTGGKDTELLSYTILGKFKGTSRGKIYRKH